MKKKTKKLHSYCIDSKVTRTEYRLWAIFGEKHTINTEIFFQVLNDCKVREIKRANVQPQHKCTKSSQSFHMYTIISCTIDDNMNEPETNITTRNMFSLSHYHLSLFYPTRLQPTSFSQKLIFISFFPPSYRHVNPVKGTMLLLSGHKWLVIL